MPEICLAGKQEEQLRRQIDVLEVEKTQAEKRATELSEKLRESKKKLTEKDKKIKELKDITDKLEKEQENQTSLSEKKYDKLLKEKNSEILELRERSEKLTEEIKQLEEENAKLAGERDSAIEEQKEKNGLVVTKTNREIKELKEKSDLLEKKLESSKQSNQSLETSYLKLSEKLQEKEKLLNDLKKQVEQREKEAWKKDKKVHEKSRNISLGQNLPEASKTQSVEVSEEENGHVQESSISSSCSDKLSKLSADMSQEIKDNSSSQFEDINLQLTTTKVMKTGTDKNELLDNLSKETVELNDGDRRKKLLKEAMRVNVEKRLLKNRSVLEKTQQVKEDAKARREKIEEGRQRKRSLLTVASGRPSCSGVSSLATPAEPSETADQEVVPTVSLSKKNKSVDTIAMKSSLNDNLSDEEDSPLFYPIPTGRKNQDPQPQAPTEEAKTPVTSRVKSDKTKKRKNPTDGSSQPQPSELPPSPPKKGKRSQKKAKAVETKEIFEEVDNPQVEAEKEPTEVKKEEKPRRGRKPKAKAEVVKEVKEVAEVMETLEATAPDCESQTRPQRNCKKKYESMAGLVSSNQNSPAMSPAVFEAPKQVEARKRGRPSKKVVTPAETDSSLAPEPKSVSTPKAPSSRRGRKPGGKKAESASKELPEDQPAIIAQEVCVLEVVI